jgi:CubicO group peptidase (beta-lactamase class C family)
VALLYILMEKGFLELDDLVTKFAPNFAVIDPFPGGMNGKDITFRMLASHLSGLPSGHGQVDDCVTGRTRIPAHESQFVAGVLSAGDTVR